MLGCLWRVEVRGSRVAAVVGRGEGQLRGGDRIIFLAEEAWDECAVHFPLECFRGAEDEEGEETWGDSRQVAGDGGHGARAREVGAGFVGACEDGFSVPHAWGYVCPFEDTGESC